MTNAEIDIACIGLTITLINLGLLRGYDSRRFALNLVDYWHKVESDHE